MTAVIKHIRNTTAGLPPAAGNLVAGQLAINTSDANLYTLDALGNVRLLASAAVTANAYTSTNTTNQLVKTINGVSPDSTGNFTLGATKNKLINGRFRLNQYGNPASGAIATFVADRWYMFSNGATVTTATGTTGSDTTYLSWQETSGTGAPYISQSINDVSTLNGQTVTVSFLINVSKGMSFTPSLFQNFGSGGSSTVTLSGTPIAVPANTWTRCQQTFSIPSVVGKTLGTNHYLRFQLATTAAPGTFTALITEVQLEQGPSYTGFGFKDLSVMANECLFYYEAFPGSPFAWSGQVGNTQVPQMTVQYAYKRVNNPTLVASNVSSSGLAAGNPTIASQTNNGARLNLPAGNVLLGAFGTYSFGLTVNAELPTT